MKIIVLTISLLILVSSVRLSPLEKANETKKVKIAQDVEKNLNPIKFTLITDEKDGPSRFEISYEVKYGEFIFKRSEKCHITEVSSETSSNEMTCGGKTNFSRAGNIKNITNFDDYNYSTNGFNHTGETFTMSGNHYHLNEIDLSYGLEPEPITIKLNHTQPAKQLQIQHIGKDKLLVNLIIESTFFSLNRTENFSVTRDEEYDTNDFTCTGQIQLMVRNSEKYNTVQNEFFILDEQYSFIYVSEFELNNNIRHYYRYENIVLSIMENQMPDSYLLRTPPLIIEKILSYILNLTNVSHTCKTLYEIVCDMEKRKRILFIRRLALEENPTGLTLYLHKINFV